MNLRRASFCRAKYRFFLALMLVTFAIVIALNILSLSNQRSFINDLLASDQDGGRQELSGVNLGDELSVVTEEERKNAAREDSFVWCDKINDWALLKSGSTVNSNRRQALRAEFESISEKALEDASSECIWPPAESPMTNNSQCLGSPDRIINQLRLKVAGVGEAPLANQNPGQHQQQDDDSFVRIAIDNDDQDHPLGRAVFVRDKCQVDKCLITDNLHEAHAIIFKNSDLPISESGAWDRWPRLATSELRSRQIWIAYMLESPPNTFDKRFVRQRRSGKHHQFNWTATYRSDSDIVTPYSKFVPYLDQIDQFIALKKLQSTGARELQLIGGNNKNHAAEHKLEDRQGLVAMIGRYKKQSSVKVAWLVSNCHSHNSRLEYAHELAKYVQVDIYGKCGNMTCSKLSQAKCLQHLNDNYKFYLAFENSNSREYITEKLYQNAYGYDDQNHLLLPIVMGPSRKDYEQLVPPGSFIHVDDFASSQELASYLKLLNSNDHLYASYFLWKSVGRFIGTKFLCRVCALMHETIRSQGRGKGVKTYKSIYDWWWQYG